MSIEREQDGAVPLPGLPTTGPAADEAAAKAAEDDARFEAVKRRVKDADPDTLNWAEKLARSAALEEERKKKGQAESVPDSTAETALPKPHATRPKKPKEHAVVATNTASNSVATQKSTPPRTKKLPPTDKELSDDVKTPPASIAKPKRVRRKVHAGLVSQAEEASVPAGQTTLQSIPPITNEAITFLNDPDSKATDLFKLAPDSQAFVRYHITNLQRLEADSELAHTYLLATAPKHSPRFEKAVDALVTKLAKERPVLANVLNKQAEPAQTSATATEKPNAYYGPEPVAVTVNLAKPEAPNIRETLTKPLQENTIEPSIAMEKAVQPFKDSQQEKQDDTDSVATPTTQSTQRGQKFLRGVESVIHAATSWLQNGERESTPASESLPSASPSQPIAPTAIHSTFVPEAVARRFLKVEQDYYFLDRTPAFSDRGNKLATRGEHPEVVRSLVDIAIARGWDNITVKGTESFRRAAWMEAVQSGLKVAGYQPTILDLADLANRPGRNVIEKGAAKDRPDPSPVTEPTSVGTGVGELQKSKSSTSTIEGNGTPAKDAKLVAKANSFETGKPASVVKKHPDLAPAYGVIHAAKKFAESNLPENAKDEFIGIARRYVMNKIISGEVVAGPKVFMTSAKSKDSAYASETPNEKQIFDERRPREKEIARER